MREVFDSQTSRLLSNQQCMKISTFAEKTSHSMHAPQLRSSSNSNMFVLFLSLVSLIKCVMK